jgi:hypothetical protein
MLLLEGVSFSPSMLLQFLVFPGKLVSERLLILCLWWFSNSRIGLVMAVIKPFMCLYMCMVLAVHMAAHHCYVMNMMV